MKLLFGKVENVYTKIEKNSVDLIATDLPYGITSNKWDSIIPFSDLWKIVEYLLKPTGVFLTTAFQPFSSQLVVSNIPMFKHEWVWIKNRGSNFANTVREPMKEHETILVFSKGRWTYNKQMQERTGAGLDRVKYAVSFNSKSKNYRDFKGRPPTTLPELRVPSSHQKFNTDTSGEHPTKKPVDLFRYLVKTYSNPNDLVIDICMGVGTTGEACKLEGRKFIGIESDRTYYDIARTKLLNRKVAKR